MMNSKLLLSYTVQTRLEKIKEALAMKFRAAAMEGIGKIRLVEREVEPEEDQIVVKTHASSICLADLQIFRKGYYTPGDKTGFPSVSGS